MNYIEIKSSRLKLVVLLISAIGFVGGGLFILLKGEPDQAWIGWMSIVFFGAGIPLFTYELIRSAPRLVISDEGIFDRTLRIGWIAWKDVRGASIKSLQGSHFICLDVANPEQYLSKSKTRNVLMKANHALGFTPISLNLSSATVDPHEVLEIILKISASKGMANQAL
jgi:hypothetical protein